MTSLTDRTTYVYKHVKDDELNIIDFESVINLVP